MGGLPVRPTPNSEDIKKFARNKAVLWYRRIENRVAPVVAFGGLIAENTTRWVFMQRNQHYYTTYPRVREFLRNPCQGVVSFIHTQEVQALSTLWNLGYEQPNYSDRTKLSFALDPSDPNKGKWVRTSPDPDKWVYTPPAPTVWASPTVTSTVTDSVTDKK